MKRETSLSEDSVPLTRTVESYLMSSKIPTPILTFSVQGNKEEASWKLAYQRDEAIRLGFDPSRVVMLRDPFTETWVVLIPSDQFDAALSEVF